MCLWSIQECCKDDVQSENWEKLHFSGFMVKSYFLWKSSIKSLISMLKLLLAYSYCDSRYYPIVSLWIYVKIKRLRVKIKNLRFSVKSEQISNVSHNKQLCSMLQTREAVVDSVNILNPWCLEQNNISVWTLHVISQP